MTEPAAANIPPAIQARPQELPPDQDRVLLEKWAQIQRGDDAPRAWKRRFWRFTTPELSRILGRPVGIAHLALDDEVIIERHAGHVYMMAAMMGFMFSGMVTAVVLARASWRTVMLIAAVCFCARPITRLVVALVWPFECMYRRLIGQYHHDASPSHVMHDAAYWPIALLRKIAPLMTALAFTLGLNKLMMALGVH